MEEINQFSKSKTELNVNKVATWAQETTLQLQNKK